MKVTMVYVALIGAGVCAITFFSVREHAKKRTHKRDERAREEFRLNIARYSGYCEPLHQSVRAGDEDFAKRILDVWEGYMDENGVLLAVFRSTCGKCGDACAKAERWLQRLEEWGVGHDETGDTIVVDGQREAQYFLDGNYEYGDHASVVQPSWYWVDESGGSIASGIARVLDQGSIKEEITLER